MKIKGLMSTDVESCSPKSNLAEVAMIMWRKDCGVVPVVDDEARVVGVVTDRDICIAAATRHRAPDDLLARDVMSREVRRVRADDDDEAALREMREHHVRRLVVVDRHEALCGMLSLNDLVLATRPDTGAPRVNPEIVLETLREICVHRTPRAAAAKPAAREVRAALTAR